MFCNFWAQWTEKDELSILCFKTDPEYRSGKSVPDPNPILDPVIGLDPIVAPHPGHDPTLSQYDGRET